MKKAQIIEELTEQKETLIKQLETLENEITTWDANLAIRTEQCDELKIQLKEAEEERKEILRVRTAFINENKALKEKIKTKDKAFSELSWNYSQMINSDINPPSTDLKFVQITAVPAGEKYKEEEWLFGLTAEGEVFFKGATTKWEPVSMERTKDS